MCAFEFASLGGRRQLGAGGPWVGAIGLGCMGFASLRGADGPAAARTLVDAALDAGADLLDTADVYGPHTSEILLGHALAGRRQRVFLATKFGNALDRTTNPAYRAADGRPAYVRQAIEQSLQRLGTDYVDLYYLHRADPAVPIEDTVGAMADLVRQGKVRYLGLSAADADTLRRAHAVHPLAAIQSEWSVFERGIEQAVVPMARSLGIAVVAYSPLGKGLLAGELAPGSPLSDKQARHPRFAPRVLAGNLALAREATEIALRHGASAAQVALAWLLGQGEDVIPIPGARTLAHLVQNQGARGLALEDAERQRLDRLAARCMEN